MKWNYPDWHLRQDHIVAQAPKDEKNMKKLVRISVLILQDPDNRPYSIRSDLAGLSGFTLAAPLS